MEAEIAIAATALTPSAHMVSKKRATIDISFELRRLDAQALDFDFLSFLFIETSLICSPMKRIAVRGALRTSAAVGFEPTPTPEAG